MEDGIVMTDEVVHQSGTTVVVTVTVEMAKESQCEVRVWREMCVARTLALVEGIAS